MIFYTKSRTVISIFLFTYHFAGLEDFFFKHKLTRYQFLWFADTSLSDSRLLCFRVLFPLPKKTPDGVVVMLGRFGIYDPYEYNMDVIMRFSVLVTEVLCREDEEVTVTGLMLINDVAGCTMGHMAAFTPTIAKRAAIFMQVNVLRMSAPSLIFLFMV